jgi:hypothetical protein
MALSRKKLECNNLRRFDLNDTGVPPKRPECPMVAESYTRSPQIPFDYFFP